jgi:hypothetical protein
MPGARSVFLEDTFEGDTCEVRGPALTFSKSKSEEKRGREGEKEGERGKERGRAFQDAIAHVEGVRCIWLNQVVAHAVRGT